MSYTKKGGVWRPGAGPDNAPALEVPPRFVSLMSTAGSAIKEALIPDDQVTVPVSRDSSWAYPAQRTPDFTVEHLTRELLRLQKVIKPAVVLPGTDVEVQPEREVVNYITISDLVCPECGDTRAKEGVALDTSNYSVEVQRELPNAIVQCENCRVYIYLTVFQKEGKDDKEKYRVSS